MMQQLSVYESARIKFRDEFKKGITPVDGRQPIPDELAKTMVQELIDLEVPKDALIGIFDAFLILSTHLKEVGYTNLVLLENTHNNLSNAQEMYYSNVQNICKKSGIKYYVPPMNNYERCNMKFDVIIGNPPYGDTKEGTRSGSSSEPLWWQIIKISFNLLKDDGIISFITPTTIVNGGEQFTELFLGKNAKYDLKKVDFSADDYFKVGIDICRWVAKKSKPSHFITINDGRVVNSSRVDYISQDKNFDEILETLVNYDGDKLTFNQTNSYDYRSVAKKLKKSGLPEEWSKDIVNVQNDEYLYPVANNDKIKYSRVKWKDYEVWRVFAPQFVGNKDMKFWIDDKMAATGTTWTHRCNSKEDAEKILSIVDTIEYKWIINKLKVNGRITGKIRSLPATHLSEVLSPEQLAYIQSQL